MLEWFFRVPDQFFTTCANATQRRKVVREKGKSSAIVDSDTLIRQYVGFNFTTVRER